jgi:hypothetical protein
MIYAAQRLLKRAGRYSACLIAGTDKQRNGFGCGDCLLADPLRGVFIVADATERFPRASRRLLQRLMRFWPQQRPLDPGSFYAGACQGYAAQKYVQRSTLSGVLLQPEADGCRLGLIHGGDSMVLLVHAGSGAVRYRTQADMCFAGRSRWLPRQPIQRITEPGLRILLATDGFMEVLRALDVCRAGCLPPFVVQGPVDQAAQRLQALLAECGQGVAYDDIAFILIDPFNWTAERLPTVLIGGTTAAEEALFRRCAGSRFYRRWLPPQSWFPQRQVLKRAGIHVSGNNRIAGL